MTDRDRVVAELGPPKPERSAVLADALLADGVRKGWMRPPVVGVNDAPPSPKGIHPLNKILLGLAIDRSDR